MPRILIVEDELAIAEALQFAFGQEAFEHHHVALAGEALRLLRPLGAAGTFDLVVFDVGLPDMTGFEACKELRSFSNIPVLFLTARGSEIDRVLGLELGADDYVVKPFSPREVVARVRTILRRSGGRAMQPMVAMPAAENDRPRNVPMAEFVIDVERIQIRFQGQLLKLTPLEFRLLQRLLSQPERVFSREQLLEGENHSASEVYARNVDGHIRTLRAKLRVIEAAADPIETHRGFGYRYCPGRKAAES